jgi:2-(1,2-epoxy-1,2-dihydrophenyl)acetyl-CoA isomerase
VPDAQPLLVDVTDGVATLCLNRPESANSLSQELLRALDVALREAELDPEVGAIVLAGEGRGFCAGGNASVMAGTVPTDKLLTITRTARMVEMLVSLQTPVVAAVHGYAVGAGISLALACDLVVAARDTRFRLGFRDLGLIPDMGLHHHLVEAVGPWRAKELIWTGASFTADDAHEWGFVNRVVDAADVQDVATGIARDLADGPRFAISYTKRVVAEAHAAQLRAVLAAEGSASSLLRTTNDYSEGVAAAKEKRPPRFGQT